MTLVPSPDSALAEAINATAARFEAVFDRAKPLPENPNEEGVAFASLSDRNSSSREKITNAVAYARANGWLYKLIEQYVTGGEAAADVDAVLMVADQQGIITLGSTLEGIKDPLRGFAAAGIELQHFSLVMRQVCRIDIDGNPKGTGFLVSPDTVITSYHVIMSLTEYDVHEKIQAQAHSSRRMSVVFDDIDVLRNGHRARLPGFTVPVAEKWLEDVSPCHILELKRAFPNNFADLENKLDYALIRLSGIARVGIPPVTIREKPPAANDKITIFQHPDGRALSLDRACITAVCGPWRFEHNVNSEGGSSGSPCFDQDYLVIGIHQGGFHAPGRPNRAVPLGLVLPSIKKLKAPDPRLTPMSDLTEGEPGHPVLGRIETQRWVWGQLDGGDKPILVIWGEDGRGKSFTYDILRSLLPVPQHDVVSLMASADIQKHSPETFAATLLERLGYPPMAPGAYDVAKTRSNWLKEDHLSALINALDAGRRRPDAVDRGVWIVIDDIHKAVIDSSMEIRDYLFRLYAATRTYKWLRFVLLGFDGALPDELEDMAKRHVLIDPSDDDLRAYLQSKVPPHTYEAQKLVIDTVMYMLKGDLPNIPRVQQLKWLQRRMKTVASYWASRQL
jgi:hypothetical protein